MTSLYGAISPGGEGPGTPEPLPSPAPPSGASEAERKIMEDNSWVHWLETWGEAGRVGCKSNPTMLCCLCCFEELRVDLGCSVTPEPMVSTLGCLDVHSASSVRSPAASCSAVLSKLALPKFCLSIRVAASGSLSQRAASPRPAPTVRAGSARAVCRSSERRRRE